MNNKEYSYQDKLSLLPRDEYIKIIKSLNEEQLEELEHDWRWNARPKQLLCFSDDWNTFMYLCGRGFGKSRTACEWVREKALQNPGCKIAVVGATASIVNRTVVLGDGGIMEVCRPGEADYKRGDALIKFKNGSMVFLYSADEPKRLRGPNHHFALADDIIAWRYPEAYHMLKLTVRIGKNPQTLITTSAGATPLILDIITNKSEDENVIEQAVNEVNSKEMVRKGRMVIVRGTTFENNALPLITLEQYKEEYPESSVMGQQELYARIVLKVEGALWDRKWIGRSKAVDKDGNFLDPVGYRKTVMAIDPAVSANKNSDHTAITIASLGIDGRYYVRYSERYKVTPKVWSHEAIRLYYKYGVDKILAEKNNGGLLVEDTLRNVNSFKDLESGEIFNVNGEDLPIELIHAKTGKYVRATPIAALYENRRVDHVGTFSDLEQQMLSFKGEPNESDDLVDSLVYALLELSGAKVVEYTPPKVGGIRSPLNLDFTL